MSVIKIGKFREARNIEADTFIKIFGKVYRVYLVYSSSDPQHSELFGQDCVVLYLTNQNNDRIKLTVPYDMPIPIWNEPIGG